MITVSKSVKELGEFDRRLPSQLEQRFLQLLCELEMQVARDQRVRHGDTIARLQSSTLRCVISHSAALPVGQQLTKREAEIARLVACGKPGKTIAAELGISRWTVEAYVRRIFAKLGVASRPSMIARLAGFANI